MSIIIKGMDMPKSCSFCRCICGAYPSVWRCGLTDKIIDDYAIRDNSCPLVELSEKHGRLIDGDYLYDRLKALGLKDENVFRIIKEEPTVIESEE